MWIGNALWLDFVNTRYVDRERPVDVLASFAALVDWLAEAGALPFDAAREAVERWERTPEGDEVLREAVALRKALHGLAEALAVGGDGSNDAAAAASADGAERREADAVQDAVDAINRVFRTCVSYAELSPPPELPDPEAPRASSFRRLMRPTDAHPRRLLALVAESASDFLCGRGDATLVRRCGNPKCVLYFYDTTKNRHRRFCSATGCGNRVKAAARYRRVREAKGEGAAGSRAAEGE